MMGRKARQTEWWSEPVNVFARIPEDHLLRRLNRCLDLDFVRAEVVGKYGRNGQVSVDPVVIVKMMLLLFLDDVKSERELMRVIPLRLDYLYFLGYGLEDTIPDHSVLSKARQRWGKEVFERLFAQTVAQCWRAGLISGDKVHVDASLIRADASLNSVAALEHTMAKLTEPEGAAEPERTDKEEPPRPGGPVNERHTVQTDPDATMVRHRTGKSLPSYKNHRLLDDHAGVITAMETTTGCVPEAHQLLELIEAHVGVTGRLPRAAIGDSSYGTTANFIALGQLGIRAHLADLRSRLRNVRQAGIYAAEEFRYDKKTDSFTCPAGQPLFRHHFHAGRGHTEYRARVGVCAGCPRRAACTRDKAGRTLKRYPEQELLDRARKQSHGPAARRDRKRRQWFQERNFGEAAVEHGYKRARWRGLWRQQIQDLLIAAIQNLKILLRRAATGVSAKGWLVPLIRLLRPFRSICHVLHTTFLSRISVGRVTDNISAIAPKSAFRATARQLPTTNPELRFSINGRARRVDAVQPRRMQCTLRMKISFGLQRLVLVLFFAVIAGRVGLASGPERTVRVLFLGNSYTYVNDLPALVAQLLVNRHVKLEHQSVTPGGATLAKLWQDGAALDALQKSKWDFVVLQEQSVRPIKEREAMYAAARLFHAAIAMSGAQTLLYETWAAKVAPDEQPKLTEAYEELGRELGATVVPVGEAWKRALAAGEELHGPDGRHPNRLGSYLAACLFARAIGGEAIVGSAPLITENGVPWNKPTARELESVQRIAEETWPGRPSERANAASPQKRIYLANDDHTDYMWTADAETYAGVFVDMLDYYLALADATDANPAPYQSRFNPDGSFWLWTYERKKTSAEFARLMARIKDGHISAPLNALVSCYGGQPAEAALRGMYYAGRLERRFDVRFQMAIANENQTLPLGLASLWAGSGARYSWKGVCGCASKLNKDTLQRRPHEIYWAAGADGQRVLMKWYSLGLRMGTYLEAGWPYNTTTKRDAGGPLDAVRFLDSNPDFLTRYRDADSRGPYQVRGAFGFGGDSLAEKTGVPGDPGVPAEPGVPFIPGWPETDHFYNIARQASTPERQVICSNETDFFQDFEKTHGATLPTESVTYGNEWDLYSASMSETSARVRRSVEKLRAAELMAALVSLARPSFLHGREASRDQAFMDIGLYWEHDWTADGPVSRASRAAWEELLASEIEAYVNSLHADAALRLGGLIRRPDEKVQRFFVLNPLGFARTDFADFAYQGKQDIHVRDVATGQDVPHQFVRLDGVPKLRILASSVPSAGYKVFEILSGAGSAPTDPAAEISPDHSTIENARLRVVVDPDGAVASLVDKAHPGADFAATIDGLKLNDFAAHETAGQAVTVENSGPVSVTLKCVSEAGVPHTTRITLFRDSNRVEILNEINENFADVRHWAFSFNLPAPDVHTEEVGAILHDKTKAAGGDYADTHARYDYATLNHFADVTDGANGRGVTLSNADCAFVKLGHSTSGELDTATAQLNVLAGGQVDGGGLGIRAQNGTIHFIQRFALGPHAAYDQLAAMKFALAHQNPFVTGAIISKQGGAYPEATYSLLSASDPDILLWALKVPEDGIEHGLAARFWNASDSPHAAEIAFSSTVAAAERTTHLETAIEPVTPSISGRLPVAFTRQQLQTYLVRFK